MRSRLRVGTRKSPLARRQTELVIAQVLAHFPDLEISVETIVTSGDTFEGRIGPGLEGKGLFIKEIEEALLDRRIDLAVHSMKDMPALLPPGLEIAAVPKRADARDALIGCAWKDLPQRARVGTGSPRRVAQLLHARPDLQIEPLRGNVDTRLRKKREEGLDAIVLACAGLDRLDLQGEIAERLSPQFMLPAPGQGALALEARAGEERIAEFVRPLHDAPSERAVTAERGVLQFFGAGCSVPLAAFASVEGSQLRLRGFLADPLGRRSLCAEEIAALEDREIAHRLGEKLLQMGAREILGS